jgi:hypothetical protein
MSGIFSIIRGRGVALRLPRGATARVRLYLLRRYMSGKKISQAAYPAYQRKKVEKERRSKTNACLI